MDELEQLRQKRLQELQGQGNIQDQQDQESQLTQQVAALEQIVKKKLDKYALERYSNIKLADPQKAVQLLLVLAQVIQSTNVAEITDEQFKDFLMRIPQKREMKIIRK